MWLKELKNIFLFWLLACLCLFLYINLLQAENIDPMQKYTNLTQKQLVEILQKNSVEEKIISNFYRNNFQIVSNKLKNLEESLKTSTQKTIDLEASLMKMQEYSKSYEENSKKVIQIKDDRISDLELQRYFWCIGGIAVGVSLGILITVLVSK